MNFLSVISFALLSSAASFAADCPNFSGHYALEVSPSNPTPIDLTIQQSGCDQLVAYYESAEGKKFDRPMIVDGKMHPTIVTNAFTVTEAFTWQDGGLAYQQETQTPDKVTQAMGTISLESDSLVEETFYLGSIGQPASHERAVFRRKH